MRANRTLRLRINVEERDPTREEAEVGDREDDLTLNFESPAVFFRLFTANCRTILDALRGGAQLSLIDLARSVGQSPDQVKVGVSILVRLGVLEPTKNGEVRCPFDRIEWPATA